MGGGGGSDSMRDAETAAGAGPDIRKSMSFLLAQACQTPNHLRDHA